MNNNQRSTEKMQHCASRVPQTFQNGSAVVIRPHTGIDGGTVRSTSDDAQEHVCFCVDSTLASSSCVNMYVQLYVLIGTKKQSGRNPEQMVWVFARHNAPTYAATLPRVAKKDHEIRASKKLKIKISKLRKVQNRKFRVDTVTRNIVQYNPDKIKNSSKKVEIYMSSPNCLETPGLQKSNLTPNVNHSKGQGV